MVVSGSETAHKAGRPDCVARACAAAPPTSSDRPKATPIRRSSDFSINSILSQTGFAWGRTGDKLNVYLPRASPSAKAATLIETATGRPLEPKLPGPDLDAPSLLGSAGLRHPPAVRYGDGGGDLPPGYRAAFARTRSVERRVRPAVPPPDRRPLWREPEPAWSLLPVSGGPETQPGRPPGPVSRKPRRYRHRPAQA